MTWRATIVVPCYDEEERLDLTSYAEGLRRQSGLHLLFVDDGSRDRTRPRLEEFATEQPGRVTVLALDENSGKAEAVRRGVLAALDGLPGRTCAYVGYWDADLSTPLEEVDHFLSYLSTRPDIDVVLGSRVLLLGRQIERQPARHYLGRTFATAASTCLGLPVYDTQCGAKMFRHTPWLRDVWDSPFRSRWLFDVELLFRLMGELPRQGKRFENSVVELPLEEWIHAEGSKVSPFDFVRSFFELARITWHYRRERAGRHLSVPTAAVEDRDTA